VDAVAGKGKGELFPEYEVRLLSLDPTYVEKKDQRWNEMLMSDPFP